MKTFLKVIGITATIIIAVVAITTIAAWWNNYSYTRDTSTNQAPVMSVSSSQIIYDYQENEVAADDKYKDKIVQINGYVIDVSKDMLGMYVHIGTKNENSAHYFIASFSKNAKSLLIKLRMGQPITVKCKIYGLSISDVLGEKCSIIPR